MKHTSKPSEASATHSPRNEFWQATLNLTAFYTLGVLAVLVFFNVLVYTLFIQQLDVQIESGRPVLSVSTELRHDEYEAPQERVVEAVRNRLVSTLANIDIFVIILSVLVSYVVSRRTLRPLERAYQRQKRFVSDAAHELRTPLSVMKAGAETALSRKRTIGEYTTYLTDTLEEVNALTSLAEDLLTLAKTDTIAFQKTAVDLSQLLAQQVRVMRPYAQKKNVTLSEKTVQDAVTVFGSEQYLRRTCANLIKNAVDYNRPGGGVTVSLAARGGNAVLSVSDTGIGIAEKDLPHVFERFYKADAARSVGAGGSGLGLAIVRDIVSAHNGSVHIDSTEGKGTTVVVTFPLA